MILIAQGKIVINDRLDRVRSDEAIVVEVRGSVEQAKKTIEGTHGVGRVSRRESRDGDVHVFEVKGRDHAELREQVAKRLVGAGLALRRLELSRSTLEDRFVQAVNAAAANEPDHPSRDVAVAPKKSEDS